jgi:pimeloyl-ACP methyl ester carboxylesterase
MVKRSHGCIAALALAAAASGCAVPEPSGFTIGEPGAPDASVAPPAESTFSLTHEEEREHHFYKLYEFRHPVEHGVSEELTVRQRVHVIIPKQFPFGAHLLAYIHFGDKQRSEVEYLEEITAVPRFIAAKAIYVLAEHRGYGESVSDDSDQSVPAYVTTDGAIDDAQAVIEKLSAEYGDAWMTGGYGYGGSLALEHAARYPDSVEVVLSSSGIVRWPRTNSQHESRIQAGLPQGAYTTAVEYMAAIEPAEPFDENWVDRELMELFWSNLAQGANGGELVALAEAVLDLSVAEVAAFFRSVDSGASDAFSSSRALRAVSREQALARDVSGRMYYYQQCTQLGALWVSGQKGGVFQRTAADHQAECEALFGDGVLDLSSQEPAWDIDIGAFAGPDGPRLIYIRGGHDPWADQGMPVPTGNPVDTEDGHDEYTTDYGVFFDVSGGLHVPHLKENLVHVMAWVRAFELAGL